MKRLAKIVLVITRSDIGGAQNHVLSLIDAFRDSYSIVLVVGSEGELSKQVRLKKVPVYLVAELDSYNPLKAILKLRKVFAKESPDLVHTHSSLASFYGRATAKLCGCKVLYTVHGWHFASERNPLKWLIKVGLELGFRRLTDRWITVSEFDRKLGDKFFLLKPKCAQVIANGIINLPISKKALSLNDSGQSLEVVFVGRSTYQKNCDLALAVLAKTQSNINLTMFASGGQISDLQKAHEKSPVRERITLILNEPNAASEMGNFSVMLITSRYEGMPLGVIEAMRSGLTVVSTDVCGMNELIIDGENGFLFKESDAQGMARQLNLFADDRQQLIAMGEASRERYDEQLTLDKMLASTELVYKKMLA